MKQKIFLLLMVSSLFIYSLCEFEQVSCESVVAPPIEWQSTVGGFKVEETTDRGFIVFGTKRLSKIDSLGNLVWTQTYSHEFYSGDQCSDGGFVLTGGTILVKTDESGNIQWERNYEETGFLIRLRAVQQSTDGGFVLAGWRIPNGVNNDDFFLVKTDSSGNIEWKKTIGEESANEMAYDVLQTPDGGYIVVGATFRFDSLWTDAWVVKTDQNGNLIWSKTYGAPDPRGDWIYSISPTNEGGYIMAGCGNRDPYRTQESGDFWLLQIDNSGNQQWSRLFGEHDIYESASAVKQTNDGCFIAVGDRGSTVTWLIKTDPSDSSIVWDKIIEASSGVLEDVIQTDDRGFAVAAGSLIKIMRANPPVSIYNYSPMNITIEQEVFFNASESYDLDEDIVSYNWDFDDGTTLSTTNSTISHSFELPRNYNVTLTVIDSEELNSTNSQSILVKIHSSISISPNSNITCTGEPIEFTGKLIDAYGNGLSNENISIYYGTTGNENWTPITNITTDSFGNYVSTWTNSNPRTYSIKVEWAGNQTFYGTANTTNIQILPQPTLISVSLISTSTQFGFKVGITGSLTSNDVGLGDFPIRLSYSVTEGQSWNDVSLVRTDSEGNYAVEWLPSATGIYIVKALWEGNSSYPRTKVTANLVVVSFEDESVFSVASNSTVSGLVFNSTNNELSFTLSGATGTKGYVEASISKTLILDINEVQVYLDNTPIDFEYSSLEDSWLLFFDYSHSLHEAIISLNPSSIPFDGSNGNVSLGEDILPIVAVLSVIVVCGIIVIFLARKRRTS